MNLVKFSIKVKVVRMICINLFFIWKLCNILCEFWMFLNEFDINILLYELCEK